jgi:hypothetical protein
MSEYSVSLSWNRDRDDFKYPTTPVITHGRFMAAKPCPRLLLRSFLGTQNVSTRKRPLLHRYPAATC